jgi:hypothetical protein
MNLDLTDVETAALLRELNGLIDGDRYFMSGCGIINHGPRALVQTAEAAL